MRECLTVSLQAVSSILQKTLNIEYLTFLMEYFILWLVNELRKLEKPVTRTALRGPFCYLRCFYDYQTTEEAFLDYKNNSISSTIMTNRIYSSQ